MYISRHMTADPVTVSSAMSLPEARALLNDFRFRHLPVVDENGALLGMLTDRDLRSAYPSSVLTDSERRLVYEKVEKTTVAEIMSTDCVTLRLDSTLDDALFLFDRDQMGALPVLDGERVVGVFSIRDLTTAYKKLFGVGEKGSMLIGIDDDGSHGIMTRIVNLLEEQNIPFTRLMRVYDERKGNTIYLRINTFKIAKVYSLLEDAGLAVKRA
ncbi:MAG: CBS domain-containing protein [Proteobacteria bacterium]|nr:CBS domain-containing protein [Pseudomonadota bacterium]MBU1232880.1 CBS domain-containing protein [Pseudomonadota bacterium]MBU1419313.1 CBS domain-containing protein [Pseudomonadota bacterium]MBU1455144.1 CBS domain-containing protein [Pseudomonadota bacterium]